MKLVMTLLVRDEADIVEAQIAFHLHAGVDFVVATDNGSEDGTVEILERYERAGFLHLLRQPIGTILQDDWVTRVARLAATDFGADWVVNSDADEFWWPRGGSLKDVLAAVPARYGIVRGCWRHFLPRPGDGTPFYEHMTVRLRTPVSPGDKSSIYHVHQKVAHRADADVTVASGKGLDPIRAWHPLEVLHFSYRSPDQLARKAGHWRQLPEHLVTPDKVAMWEAERAGRLRDYFESFAVGNEDLDRGLAAGTLAVDTRLRDALRSLRSEDGSFRLPAREGPSIAFPRPDVGDDAEYASETALLVDVDAAVRAEERVAAAERRLERLERGAASRLRLRLARR
jgi:hypothetical protein